MFGHYKYAIHQNGQTYKEIADAAESDGGLEAQKPAIEPTEDAKALEEHLRKQDLLDPDLQGNH